MEDSRFDEFEATIFNAPADKNIKVWRYMDFTKFVSLLNTASLHLTRCDQFDDPYEGSATQHEVKTRLENYKNSFSAGGKLSPEQASVATGEVWRKFQRQYIFINCWHINEYESAAMWKLYAKSNEAIVIQTSFNSLRSLLPASCHIGMVKYIDHQIYVKGKEERFYNVMYKRKSFEHERELRVCYVDNYDFQQHLKNAEKFFTTDNARLFETIPVDLQSLIETVRIAPDAPIWLVNLVRDTISKFGYNLPVSQSDLNGQPCY